MSGTTNPGYINSNGQEVLRSTNRAGNDHMQKVYVLRCTKCRRDYGANGSDIHERKCPYCQGGRLGLPTE